MARNCIIVNLDKCTGCYGCEIACKMENDVALGHHLNRVVEIGPLGEYPNMTRYKLPTMCQQCVEAPCVDVCPTGASYRTEDDVVMIDQELCIGCQSCLQACPYGARDFDDQNQTVAKCTMCDHLTAEGELPACVKSCAAGARFYGDLDDPESDAAKELARYGEDSIHRLADAGNQPATCYILSPKIGEWQETF